MECCRVCLTTNDLSNIFATEEIATNITAIACVDISQDDGLPQFICILCKHELDISINFKDKCETTFEMLKEQHNKEIEVKENIILNLLSGGCALDKKLPEGTRECILNTVKKSIKDGQNITEVAVENGEYSIENKPGKEDSIITQEGGVVWQQNEVEVIYKQDENSGENQSEMEVSTQDGMESTTDFNDNDQTIMTDIDDQMTDVTEGEIEIPESLNIANQDLMCLKCNFCFMNEEYLFDHMKRMHATTMGQCQICLLYFPTGQLLREHLKSKHDVTDEGENGVTKCRICNKVFQLQSELNAHLCTNSEQSEFWCEMCRMHFNQEANLDNHIKLVHHNQVEFACDLCNEKFDEFGTYKRHLAEHSVTRIESNQIELACSKCNKSFSSNDELSNHINSLHNEGTGNCAETSDELENSFVCPLCEKCFRSDSLLQAHVRIHTGTAEEDVHKCPDCHKIFTQASTLARHQRNHKRPRRQGFNSHICSICQMSFQKINSLENHLLLHNNLIKFTKEQIYINTDKEEVYLVTED